MKIYNLEQDFMSAYSYVLVPISMRDAKVELRKLGKFDIEDASNEELDLLTPIDYMTIRELEESTNSFNPFEVKGNLLACRFPMTAMEIYGIMAYLESMGLVNVLSGNDGFGTSVKTVDWDNVPPNGFALCMVQEMVDVPAGHSSEKVVHTHIVSDEVEVVIEPEVEEVLTEIIEDLKVAEVVEDV